MRAVKAALTRWGIAYCVAEGGINIRWRGQAITIEYREGWPGSCSRSGNWVWVDPIAAHKEPMQICAVVAHELGHAYINKTSTRQAVWARREANAYLAARDLYSKTGWEREMARLRRFPSGRAVAREIEAKAKKRGLDKGPKEG